MPLADQRDQATEPGDATSEPSDPPPDRSDPPSDHRAERADPSADRPIRAGTDSRADGRAEGRAAPRVAEAVLDLSDRTGPARLTASIPVRFPEETLAHIRARAEADHRTVSAWIRHVVQRELERSSA